jgi:hypothetical protein
MKHQDLEMTFVPMKRTKPRKSYDEQSSKQKGSWKDKRKQAERQREKSQYETTEL